MPATEVVSDASVVLKWFHAEAEEEVGPSRALLVAHRDGGISLIVLDLTAYEVGNALLRGRASLPGRKIGIVLDAIGAICPAVRPDAGELRAAAQLAEDHGLTLYDAAYVAVARARGSVLATLDRALIDAGLGRRPSELVRGLPS